MRNSLVQVLRRRAVENPGRTAYTFLDASGAETETLTWAGLDERARAIAAALQEMGAEGERALL
ncbi:MAG TPA: acyl-CoA synthetase, partial [Rubrobacteraceae bacterium]|nr:acyl-CoA synthetase [Rubrobacteraceae bacterium]